MKKFSLIIISIFYAIQLNAQINTKAEYLSQMKNPTKSFTEIKTLGDAYFDSIKSINGGTVTKAEKDFKRWEYFWKDRASYPDCAKGGDFSQVPIYSKSALQKSFSVCNTSPYNFSWTPIAPISMSLARMGIVTSVAIDYSNPNIIYAGSNYSGLWKTTDGGANWINKTDILGIPGMGVSSIIIDPLDHNILYIATGSNERALMTYGIGVLKSSNGGSTWDNTYLTSNGNIDYRINAIKFNPNDHTVICAIGSNSA